MKEAEEEGGECFLRLTSNTIKEKTASIVCMRRKAITFIRKIFILEDSLLVSDKAKSNKEAKNNMTSQKLIRFDQPHLIQYVDHKHPWTSCPKLVSRAPSEMALPPRPLM